MRHAVVYALAAAVGIAGATVAAQQARQEAETKAPVRAYAEIKGEGITGRADLEEVRAADWTPGKGDPDHFHVRITLTASGLTPGLHGVHIHEHGRCEPDFTAAGGHFDPGPHGMTDPDANHPFHMGDLPNLHVGDDGEGSFTVVTSRITLSSGPLSVFDEDGSAFIIHGNPDQRITGAAGSGVSGGPRVACGVIRKAQ